VFSDPHARIHISLFVYLPGSTIQASKVPEHKYNQLAYEVGSLCGLVNKCILVSIFYKVTYILQNRIVMVCFTQLRHKKTLEVLRFEMRETKISR